MTLKTIIRSVKRYIVDWFNQDTGFDTFTPTDRKSKFGLLTDQFYELRWQNDPLMGTLGSVDHPQVKALIAFMVSPTHWKGLRWSEQQRQTCDKFRDVIYKYTKSRLMDLL